MTLCPQKGYIISTVLNRGGNTLTFEDFSVGCVPDEAGIGFVRGQTITDHAILSRSWR
ncbi:hypothetical protein FACS1894191_5680 [Clostridia bacterium]|nr:hypothetical protein FACS1894191_5680 [Clostridia bacterium]